MTLYPALNTAEHTVDQSYRIQEIVRLRTYLETERDKRASLYKKYRRGANCLEGVDAALFTVSLGMGAGGLGLLSTIVAVPVVMGLEIGAIACGACGAASKLISRQLSRKAKKHDEIRVLAESKLNSIADLVSKALEDSNISDIEFRLVVDEVAKYQQMKKDVRTPGGKNVDEEALIQKGREQARKQLQAEITEHMATFSTLQKNSG